MNLNPSLHFMVILAAVVLGTFTLMPVVTADVVTDRNQHFATGHKFYRAVSR